jgi:hypothetical protein
MHDVVMAAIIAGVVSTQSSGELDPTFAANMHWVVIALLPGLVVMALLTGWHSRLPEGRRKSAIETFVAFGALPMILGLLALGTFVAKQGGLHV